MPSFAADADLADLIGVGVVGLLTIAFVGGIVLPVAARQRLESGHIEAAARSRQRVNAMAAAGRALEAEAERTRGALAAASLQVRPAAALNERLATLVALAGENGVTVQDLKPGDSVRNGPFVKITLHVSGHGSYPAVSRFFHRLNERMPDIHVSAFGLTGSPGGGGAGGQVVLSLRWLATPSDEPTPVPAVATLPVQ